MKVFFSLNDVEKLNINISELSIMHGLSIFSLFQNLRLKTTIQHFSSNYYYGKLLFHQEEFTQFSNSTQFFLCESKRKENKTSPKNSMVATLQGTKNGNKKLCNEELQDKYQRILLLLNLKFIQRQFYTKLPLFSDFSPLHEALHESIK